MRAHVQLQPNLARQPTPGARRDFSQAPVTRRGCARSLGRFEMKRGYCLSCHSRDPRAYVFMVPLRASAAWLKKVLRRRWLINGIPLRKKQFEILSRRIERPVEVGWFDKLEYFLEAYEMGVRPNHPAAADPERVAGLHAEGQRSGAAGRDRSADT